MPLPQRNKDQELRSTKGAHAYGVSKRFDGAAIVGAINAHWNDIDGDHKWTLMERIQDRGPMNGVIS